MEVLTLTNSVDAPFMNQQIAALEDRGVSVTILGVPGSAQNDHTRGVYDYVRFVPEVLRESRNGFDLIHAHYGLTAPMALAQFRLPVVLSLWGSDLHLPFVEFVSRACVPFCDEVIVMSEEMQSRLGRECTIVPDGVDLDRFRPIPKSEARPEVGWSDEAYHVLFPYPPSRERKNHPRARRIVDAADRLLDRPVRFQVVWGVDHDDIPTYLNAADLLLLTSHSEGSPNSVKEALACNVPVVSTDVGDVRERLDGVQPSAVGVTDEELVDGVVDVLESGERSNGREVAREVSLERATEDLLAVYERAVA